MFLRLKGMLLRSRSLASGAMRLWGTHCTSSKGIYFTMWIHRGAGGKNCKNLQSKIWDFKGFLGLCLLSHGYVPEPLRSVLFFLSSFQKERERWTLQAERIALNAGGSEEWRTAGLGRRKHWRGEWESVLTWVDTRCSTLRGEDKDLNLTLW